MEFGRKLLQIRESKGFTQDELSDRCNISVRTIQRIEASQVKPRYHTIKVLSDVLDYDFLRIVEPQNRFRFISWIGKSDKLTTKKMKKIAIIPTTILLLAVTSFLLAQRQAGPASEAVTERPEAGISIKYAKDGTIERVDAVYDSSLTLNSLVNIRTELNAIGIDVFYSSIRFNDVGQLEALACKVRNGSAGAQFEMDYRREENQGKVFGFIYDYTGKMGRNFCAGECW
jgi:transcriptional regulator with XRE-family HTH domain